MSKLDYVNIEVGTESTYRESNGNTLPLVQVPFGMQAYAMQTDADKGGWFYNPRVNYTEGVRITNQPSPWLGDYGQVVMMPMSGQTYVDNGGRHSSVSDKVLTPNYMKMYLNRYKCLFELTPTIRGAKVRVTYDDLSRDKLFLIQGFEKSCKFEVVGNKVMVTSKQIPDVKYAENFRKFHIFDFSCDILGFDLYSGNDKIKDNEGESMSIVLKLSDDIVDINVASSYVSINQALLNKELELCRNSFDDVKNHAKALWDDVLSTIEIEDSAEKLKVFYSNLYRCFLFPHVMHEVDANGVNVHFSFYLNKAVEGVMYTDNGFWDTYRTTFPLIRSLLPLRYREIIKGLLNSYEECGWLPRWMAPFERGIMPSTLTDSVIAEAIVTDNLFGDDLEIAIAALLKDGAGISDNELHGRRYLTDYINQGYINSDLTHESVSMTLDNCYSDYAIHLALKKVDHPEAQNYYERSLGYKKLFNPASNFIERVDKNGDFDPKFNPNEWGIDFCESSGWSNNFSVVHDIAGLKDLFKTEDDFYQRLHNVFTIKPRYDVGRYNFEIHEMTEVARIDLGYFGISNQPSFHLPYVYAALGKKDECLKYLKKAHKHFTSETNGYPGDEDNGSLAAWYVFSVIGRYPFIPCSGEFIEVEPLAKKVSFKDENIF